MEMQKALQPALSALQMQHFKRIVHFAAIITVILGKEDSAATQGTPPVLLCAAEASPIRWQRGKKGKKVDFVRQSLEKGNKNKKK